MSRRKSPVVLPQPATPVLRRSARLISLQNPEGQVKSGKDLAFRSEPPRRSRRNLGPEVSERLAYSFLDSIKDSSSKKSPGSKSSVDGFSSPRRSLRLSKIGFFDANKETKSASTTSSLLKSTYVSSSFTLRRSPRFPIGGGSVDRQSFSDGRKSGHVSSSFSLRRSPRFSSGGGSVDLQSFSNGRKSGNSVLSRCSTKPISSEKGKARDDVRSRDRSRSRSRSRSRPRPMIKQMLRDSDEEEEVTVCLTEKKRMRIAKENEEENVVPKADEGKRIEIEEEEEEEEEEEGLKTKNKPEKGWTEELEVALQGAYLTVKPSPNFWKKVSKMVPGKSAQECFDRVNSDLITPRQTQPRTRARKPNLSPIPQFSLSASKLLKPNSPKTKIRQRKSNLSKKTIRHLLEKQNHMDQGLGFDLFSVLEPGTTTSNFLSTPMDKGKSLPRILESPMPCSSEDQTKLVSPPVLKQVKNKALHEKYIDHLHVREAKRKAESSRLARKENVRLTDNEIKDSVRAAKDSLFFDVQDAVQKLKSLEAENSSGSSEFCYGTDEEDDTI